MRVVVACPGRGAAPSRHPGQARVGRTPRRPRPLSRKSILEVAITPAARGGRIFLNPLARCGRPALSVDAPHFGVLPSQYGLFGRPFDRPATSEVYLLL